MRRGFSLLLPILALFLTLAGSSAVRAATNGIQDDGHFFKPQTVTEAEQIINQIHAAHDKDVRVVTFAAIPDDQRADFDSQDRQGKERFFETWAQNIGKRDRVSGIVILACQEPGHLEVFVGNHTREKAFTGDDRNELADKLLTAFKAKNYDEGLLSGMQFIQARMSHNLSGTGKASSGASANAPSTPAPAVYTHRASGGFSASTWICLGVGILVVVFIIMGIANRNRGGGPGYGAPPPGGYPPGYGGGGYPQGGGYGGGGSGGGFGRGILGGLLGGALGAWGYEKLSGRENSAYGAPPAGGFPNAGSDASNQPDTSYSGGGGDINSSPSSGGDFGSPPDSGGGGDFGSAGDSGSTGGDFGGGGGGDSSSGGDF